LKLDYDRFCSDAIVSFVDRQVKILRKSIQTSQWLTHNVFLTPHSAVVDMENVFKVLDISAGSCYPVWGSADEPTPYYFMSYFLSYVRGLKDTGKFAILEQFTSVQGHDGLGYLPPKGQVVLWTNQSIARGANQVFYFRWRTAPFGQEQLCYGILNRDNKDSLIKAKLTENISEHQRDFARFTNQPMRSEACLLYDKDNSRIVKEQFLSRGLVNSPSEYMQVGYDVELTRHFAPYVIFNINADVKSVQSVKLEGYKIVSLPVYQMTDPQFVERIEKWVYAGGTLVLSWRTGTRDQKNWATPQELPGLFTNLAGIKIHEFESLNLTKVGIRLKWLPLTLKGEVWADILEPISAKSLGWYSDHRKAYSGAPCITVNSFGKGTVYYVGTSLDSMGIFSLYRKIFKRAGLNPEFLGLGVEAVHRTTADGKIVQVILNHNPVARWVKGKRIPAFGMRIVG
jgi:beta-galactosidase